MSDDDPSDADPSVGTGPNELKEPDFHSLRGRDDFQKVLAEVETWNKAKAARREAESKSGRAAESRNFIHRRA